MEHEEEKAGTPPSHIFSPGNDFSSSPSKRISAALSVGTYVQAHIQCCPEPKPGDTEGNTWERIQRTAVKKLNDERNNEMNDCSRTWRTETYI